MTLLIVISLAALFYFSVSYYTSQKKGKTLIKSRLRKISDADGLSTIQGKVQSQKEILSIFSRTKCVYYDFKLEYWKSSTKKNEWVQIAQTNESVPYYLTDDTGNLFIDSTFADMDLYYHIRREVDSLKQDPDLHQKLMLVKNLMKIDIPENKMLRVTEYIIKAGDELTVVGDIKQRSIKENLEDMMDGLKELVQTVYLKNQSANTLEKFKTISKIEGENYYYLSDSSPKEITKATQKSKLIHLIGTAGSLIAAIVFIILSRK